MKEGTFIIQINRDILIFNAKKYSCDDITSDCNGYYVSRAFVLYYSKKKNKTMSTSNLSKGFYKTIN